MKALFFGVMVWCLFVFMWIVDMAMTSYHPSATDSFRVFLTAGVVSAFLTSVASVLFKKEMVA